MTPADQATILLRLVDKADHVMTRPRVGEDPELEAISVLVRDAASAPAESSDLRFVDEFAALLMTSLAQIQAHRNLNNETRVALWTQLAGVLLPFVRGLGAIEVGLINRHGIPHKRTMSWISYLPGSAAGIRMGTPLRVADKAEARAAIRAHVREWMKSAGRFEAVETAKRTIRARREFLHRQLRDPRYRALREQHGLPREIGAL